MSLIVDPEWTVHQLRLAYLRRVDDHYGPRVISFPAFEGPSSQASTSAVPADHLHATASNQYHAAAAAATSSSSVYAARRPNDHHSHSQSHTRQARSRFLPADSHSAIAHLDDPARHPEVTAVYSPVIAPPQAIPALRGISSFTLSPPFASSSRATRLHTHSSSQNLAPAAHHRRGTDGVVDATHSRARRDAAAAAAAAAGVGAGAGTVGVASAASTGGATPSEAHPASEGRRRGGGLKYTQTIYGPGRTGALGMRVNGRRATAAAPSASASTGAGQAQSQSQSGSQSGSQTPSGSLSQIQAASASGVRTRPPRIKAHTADVPRVAIHSATADTPHVRMQPRSRPRQKHPRSGSLGGDGEEQDDDASSEAETDTTDIGEYSPAVPPVPLPPPPDIAEPGPRPSTLRRRSASAEETLGAGAGGVAEMGAGAGSTLTLRSESSMSSLSSSSAAAGQLSTDAGLKAKAASVPALHPDGTPVVAVRRDYFTPSADVENKAHTEFPFGGGAEADDGEDGDAAASSSVSNAQDGTKAGTDAHLQASSMPLPSGPATAPPTPAKAPPPQPSITTTTADGTTSMMSSTATSAPSSEALIAARSKLRKPSRSHLRGMTPAQQAAEKERQQNAWFQSLSIGQSQVAQRHTQPKSSALSMMLQKQSAAPTNPFAQFYAGISGRNAGAAGSATIDLYFPWSAGPPSSSQPNSAAETSSNHPSGALSADAAAKCLKLNVRKDASMEELIGHSLYCYVEEGWTPPLEHFGPEDICLTTIGWVLRIVEDGEVDDDYPALDRSLTVGKFGGDEFAICQASPAQIKQHEASQGLIQRRASRMAAPGGGGGSGGNPSLAITTTSGGGSNAHAKPHPAAAAAGAGAGAAAGAGAGAGAGGAAMPAPAPANLAPPPAIPPPAGSLISVQGTPIIASSALAKSAMHSSSGIFLRVLVTPNPEVRYKTTLSVPSEMYLADVLDLICKKRRLANADEWALIVPEQNIVVPLDRTVESLQGNHDLALVRRSSLGAQGGTAALASQSTNPNASIFKRLSEPAQPKYSLGFPAPKDVTSSFKSWTVTRRLPMFVGRHERTLTIDGDWIHIIPTDSRAFHAHHASFPIFDVVSCKQSSKVPQSFKLVVVRDGDNKRYDLEAEDARQAKDIVEEIGTRRKAGKW